jgi:molecular chaperone HtpG
LEIFNKKDIEVLFLTDAVDEFWVTVALPYQPKHNPQNIQWEFQSINRNDVDLNKIDKINKEEDIEDGNNKEEEIKDISHSSLDGLLQFCKEILDKKVADIRISKKLTDSPVCLAVDANAMDIRLERFLLEQKQIQSASAKILEINPDNKIIKNLNQIYQDPNNKDQAVDTIRTLFDLACIIEDEPIKDSKDFSRRLQKMLVL